MNGSKKLAPWNLQDPFRFFFNLLRSLIRPTWLKLSRLAMKTSNTSAKLIFCVLIILKNNSF